MMSNLGFAIIARAMATSAVPAAQTAAFWLSLSLQRGTTRRLPPVAFIAFLSAPIGPILYSPHAHVGK